MFKDELIIIRHARSMHNICQSENLDDGISKFGEIQAGNVGRFFDKNPDLVEDHAFYTSPFLRCLETSLGIVSNFKTLAGQMRPWVMPQLREYLNHNRSSVTVPNRENDFRMMHWHGFPKQEMTFDEEFNEIFMDRMHEAYDSLHKKSIVVTHGLPALVLMQIAINPSLRQVPIWDYSIDNCSITIVRKGRLLWHGRNLYHEMDYDPACYRKGWDGVTCEAAKS